MRLFKNAGLARGVCLVLVLSLLAPGAQAEATPWDQEAVTAIAAKLAGALRDLNHTVRRNPQLPMGSTQRRAQFRARESVRLLVGISRRLASQLEAGEDMDATLPTFRRLQMIRRDAERDGRRADIPAPTLERVVNAQALIDQLARFYGSEPDPTELDIDAAPQAQ